MNKALVIGIIVLFIGMSIVSSPGNIIENVPVDKITIESTKSYEEIFSHETIWYLYFDEGPYDKGFYAWGPGNITRFKSWIGNPFIGGTWTNDGKWLCYSYDNGLYEINPKTFDASFIGSGDNDLCSISYDPETNNLYGCGEDDYLYKIDQETGEQEQIGPFGSGVQYMVGMGHDIDGVLYGWDIGQDSLWTIDKNTGAATKVSELSINLNFGGGGDFDKISDCIYFICTLFNMQTCLVRCDITTGDCTIIDFFPDESFTPSVLTISYEISMISPNTIIYFEPVSLFGEKGQYESDFFVYLNAFDYTGVIDTFYKINDGSWMTYESPFIISGDEEYKFVYYSYDYVGNVEKAKVFYWPQGFNSPYVPIIDGPLCGRPKIEYDYIFNTTDPDGDPVMYFVDWGDNTCEWSEYCDSGEEITLKHIWNETGNFTIKAKAKDIHGAEGNWSDPFEVLIENNPPNIPIIDGQRRFKEGEGGNYPYTINSTDPEEDAICYLINWSDGTQEQTGYYASGKEITINVTIPSEKGTYDIFKIKAIDLFGAESNWSILEVTVPRNKATTSPLFHWFLERFPLLEVFLRAMNLLR